MLHVSRIRLSQAPGCRTARVSGACRKARALVRAASRSPCFNARKVSLFLDREQVAPMERARHRLHGQSGEPHVLAHQGLIAEQRILRMRLEPVAGKPHAWTKYYVCVLQRWHWMPCEPPRRFMWSRSVAALPTPRRTDHPGGWHGQISPIRPRNTTLEFLFFPAPANVGSVEGGTGRPPGAAAPSIPRLPARRPPGRALWKMPFHGPP